MSQIRKYAFETEFAPNGAVMSAAPKKFTGEEVELERKQAYERGAQDALAQAERQASAALEALAAATRTLLEQLETERRQMRAEAAVLAIAAARSVAGIALEAFSAERAAHAIEAAMDALRHQPRLIVRLPPKDAEALSPRIAQMTATHGYEGAVLVRDDEKLRKGEVVIDWSDGLIAIDPAEITERIESIVTSALAASQPSP